MHVRPGRWILQLKYDIVYYLMPDPKENVDPPILKGDPKSCRGSNHPVTARLLCPMRWIPRFDDNPLFVHNHLVIGATCDASEFLAHS